MCFEDPKPPDYTPLANASKESAEIMAALGREQLAFSKQQYNDAKPVLSKIADQQLAIGNETLTQARDNYEYQKGTFRPLEQGIVKYVGEMNTDAYKEGQARKAAADFGNALQNNLGQTERAMQSMGVNPNSGRFANLQRQNALDNAAGRANAMTGARNQAENTQFARAMDASGLGRNLSGASQGAYGLAINAGNSAGANTLAPGTQAMQGMAQGAATVGSGRNMLQSGLGSILNSQTSVYNTDATNSAGMFGSIMGGALGLGKMFL